MKFRQLRYFVTAAEAGSMVAAAQRLNVSQPALSRQISALEAEFGMALLARSTAGVSPTAAGAQLLVDARRILRLAAEARGTARAAEGGEAGHLRIGYFGTSVFTFVPRLLALMRRRHAGITIEIRRLGKADQIAALRTGEIDVGFGRYYEPTADLTIETVLTEPIVAALPACDVEDIDQAVPLTALMARPLLLFPAEGRPNLSDHILSALAAAGSVPARLDLAEDVASALARVAFGDMACLLPASSQAISVPEVVYRPIAEFTFETPLNCVHLSQTRTAPLQTLLTTLAEHEVKSALSYNPKA